ncbi:MAG: hypothetical protein ACTSWP_10710 [Candidatus Freyarchaeota archaeon]
MDGLLSVNLRGKKRRREWGVSVQWHLWIRRVPDAWIPSTEVEARIPSLLL